MNGCIDCAVNNLCTGRTKILKSQVHYFLIHALSLKKWVHCNITQRCYAVTWMSCNLFTFRYPRSKWDQEHHLNRPTIRCSGTFLPSLLIIFFLYLSLFWHFDLMWTIIYNACHAGEHLEAFKNIHLFCTMHAVV